MKNNLSPEEKLLNLIKGHKTSTPSSLHPRDTSKDKKIFSGTTGAKPNVKYSAKSFINTYLTFPYIKRLMLVLIGICFIYLVIAFIYPWFGLKEIKLPEVPDDKPKIAESGLELEKKTKPYEFYLQGLGQRQIFSANFVQEGTAASSVVDTDLIKHINLVGIISGDNPQAVIEDKKANKTYYLNKGQFIDELQIEDIKEGHIILNYKGQRYELYL